MRPTSGQSSTFSARITTGVAIYAMRPEERPAYGCPYRRRGGTRVGSGHAGRPPHTRPVRRGPGGPARERRGGVRRHGLDRRRPARRMGRPRPRARRLARRARRQGRWRRPPARAQGRQDDRRRVRPPGAHGPRRRFSSARPLGAACARTRAAVARRRAPRPPDGAPRGRRPRAPALRREGLRARAKLLPDGDGRSRARRPSPRGRKARACIRSTPTATARRSSTRSSRHSPTSGAMPVSSTRSGTPASSAAPASTRPSCP